MTFSEALKANETSAVKSPTGEYFGQYSLVEVVTDHDKSFHGKNLTGTWTLVKEPRVIWVSEFSAGKSRGKLVFDTLEEVKASKLCAVKFIEVIEGEAT